MKSNHVHQAVDPKKWRRLDWLLSAVIFLLGWAWLLGQNALVFERQTDSAVERYVADAVAVPLPRLLETDELLALCQEKGWTEATNSYLARCFFDPSLMNNGRGADLLKAWSTDLQARIVTARRWADAYDKAYSGLRKAMLTQLNAIKGAKHPSAADAGTTSNPFSGEGILRSPAQGQAGTQVREQALKTEQWLNALLADNTEPATQRAAKVGLLIAGKQVQRDFGKVPAKLFLNSDTRSLAESLERRRIAQTYYANGFSLPDLHQVVRGVLLGSLVLMAVVLWLRAAATPWALVSLLLGVGALLLVDLAMSADASLRYFAFRQWAGVWSLPGIGVVVWSPLLAVAGILALLRHPQVVHSVWARGLGHLVDRFWVRVAAPQTLSLLIMGLCLYLLPGFGALKSEVVIALGCLGLATFFARQTALANVGGGVAPLGWILHWIKQESAHRTRALPKHVIRRERQQAWQMARNVLVSTGAVWAGLAVALVVSLSRGDLGHMLVAVGMASVFFVLFGWRLMRWFMAAIVGLFLLLLAYIYLTQSIPSLVQTGIQTLFPYHAQERFLGMVNPLVVNASDLARVRWLMDSAGPWGWGAGWVPWGGLGEVRVSDGLPLQGPSDYVPALLVAQWGAIPGSLMMLLTLALFVAGAVTAARTALAQGVSQPVRLLAGVGLFGCVLMGFKVVLSLGGVTGVLPLTGLPVALVGYGPVSTLFGLLYLVLALGTRQNALRTGVYVRAGSGPSGVLVQRARPLIWVAGAAAIMLTLASLARMNAPLSKDLMASSCALPERDALGLLVAANQGQATAGRRVHRNAVPHCARTSYQIADALVQAVKLPQAAGSQTPANVAPVVAVAAPVAATASDADADAEVWTDPIGGIVAVGLQATRETASVSVSPALNTGAKTAADVCPAMNQVLLAWNQRIAQLQGQGAAHLQSIDAQALYTQLQTRQLGWTSASECTHRARELGLLLQSRLPQTLALGGRPERGEARRFEDFFQPNADKAVAAADFQTPSAWRGLPGCIVPTSALTAGRSTAQCTTADRAARMVPVPGPAVANTPQGGTPLGGTPPAAGQDPRPKQLVERVTLNNFWLQQQLAGRLAAVKSFSDDTMRFEWRRHSLQAGPVVALTLDPSLQDLAQRIVECFTGQRQGATACADVLPAKESYAKTHFATQAQAGEKPLMRAGSMGLVLTEVESGKVLAFANAISDCSLQALATVQPYDRHDQKRPAIGNIDPKASDAARCSPWPDSRPGTDYLALQAPALWLVPPGSSLKPLVVLAGATHGSIKPADRDRWRTILAQSHDFGVPRQQNNIKEQAITAAPTYRDVLHKAGFHLEPQVQVPVGRDLLWGDPTGLGKGGQPTYDSRWSVQTELIGQRVSVNESLVPWRLPNGLGWPKFFAMWSDKKNKLPYANQVQKYGQGALTEYPFAQALANASIGGGDIRVSAMGLADVWRSIDLRSRGRDKKAALHLLSTPGTPVPQLPLELGTPAAAELALYATSAVTAVGGTARTACGWVMADCKAAAGVDALWGKTGTSDFTQEDTKLVKPGLDLPAKLFGGVFEVQGKRYAVAVMGLRVRTANTLDNTSAPAEAALTLLRQMRQAAQPQGAAASQGASMVKQTPTAN